MSNHLVKETEQLLSTRVPRAGTASATLCDQQSDLHGFSGGTGRGTHDIAWKDETADASNRIVDHPKSHQSSVVGII